jgi:hypothetical protein
MKSLKTLTVTAILVVLVFTSCLQQSLANAQSGKQQPQSNLSMQLSAGSLGVKAHKISAQELTAYQSALGVYQEGADYNHIVGGHGTGLSPPTVSSWRISQKTLT